ncbi:hypothetical protein RBA41_22610 [Massilia sp. CCM 9210]|uniref:hypothetical protein n=1 Tax=Massilia scottii TaxID=3057166 RepID=UPI00279656BC|nr:hypothetical protein [Massilia sp. CCM 9210]MDQ1816093.1 hypothetical protein [Massilia sp. CCM 9210]
MSMGALRCALALLAVAVSSGCAVVAVTGAVVGAGVAVGSAAVSTGVAVTKGAVKVASYPFRDSDEEKAEKAKAEAQGKD